MNVFSVRRLSFGVSLVLAFLAVVPAASAVSATVVISEFRVRGPNGGSDEFIELYNLSAAPVNIGGWLIRGSNSAGTVSTRVTITANTMLGPGCTISSRILRRAGDPIAAPSSEIRLTGPGSPTMAVSASPSRI